ncbi:hypothetical protein ACVW06_000118 [Pantoea ananatis]
MNLLRFIHNASIVLIFFLMLVTVRGDVYDEKNAQAEMLIDTCNKTINFFKVAKKNCISKIKMLVKQS